MAQILAPELFAGGPAVADAAFALPEFDLGYFVLNVGDGDAQVIVLPTHRGRRDVLVVDAFKGTKVVNFINHLEQRQLIGEASRFTFIATHPHRDHISGAARFIRDFGHRIDEVWDSGYRHTGQDYDRYTHALQDSHDDPTVDIDVIQPTAGTTRYMGQVRVTVLAPAIRLRNQYDTYGIYVNDASVVLKLEFPVKRLRLRGDMRREHRYASIILGGDAQTASWAGTMLDFPTLHAEEGGSQTAESLSLTLERDEPLSADVLKVSHHGSKRGVNFELIERVSPKLLIVSCSDASTHGFPHEVSIDLLREARQPLAGSPFPGARKPDPSLGIYYTSDELGSGNFQADINDANDAMTSDPLPQGVGADGPLGSFGIVLSERTSSLSTAHMKVWRFRDGPDDDIDLDEAVQMGRLSA